jgi:hypothetical protein
VVAVLERPPAVVGSQVPRIRVAPDGVDHPRWSEIEDFIGRLGAELDEWQWDVLRVSLRRTPDLSMWAAFAVAACVPRQNGKNEILEMRELVGACLLGEPLVIHSAHLADTSKEHFRRLDARIEANPWLDRMVKHIWRTNGHESSEFENGCRIRFRTRTKGGGRGFAQGSPIVLDEPMFLAEVSMGSILPAASAAPDPQIWYTGSAVDQEIHEDGVVFARVRDRALSGNHNRLAYFEFSLDVETPDNLESEVAASPEAWAATNPAYGVRIKDDYILAERDELAERTFAVERLGVGDWPPVDGSADQVIRTEDWAALVDGGSSALDPVMFAFDVSPGRDRATITASGRRMDGLLHLEVVDRRNGTGWVVDRIVELVKKHEPAAVVCDSVGPAASLVRQLGEAGVEVTEFDSTEHARACAFLVDTVDQKGLRHLGSLELRDAIKGAKTRPMGDRWAWARKTSSVDISPLVAGTLSVWAAAEAQSGMWVF